MYYFLLPEKRRRKLDVRREKGLPIVACVDGRKGKWKTGLHLVMSKANVEVKKEKGSTKMKNEK